MNDDYEKYKRGKFYQTLNLIGCIFLFVAMAYLLFEAYWTEEIFDWGRGSSFKWISYQTSPDAFVWRVAGDAFLFLIASFVIVASVRRKGAGK